MNYSPRQVVEELDKYTGQHSFGTLEYEYAIYPHTGKWNEAEVINKAYEFKVPVKAVQGVPHKGELPTSGSFFTVNQEKKVLVSALKQSENCDGTILRVWNTTGEKLPLEISTILPVASVERVRLDETHAQPVNFKNGKFSIELGAHKIETFLIKTK